MRHCDIVLSFIPMFAERASNLQLFVSRALHEPICVLRNVVHLQLTVRLIDGDWSQAEKLQAYGYREKEKNSN